MRPVAQRQTHDVIDGEALAALLVGAARGNQTAWRRLIEVYGRRVYALAKSRCRDPELAEEVTQSVFATVATSLERGGYQERGRFEAWLFRIAMNRIRDEMRRRKRRAGTADPEAMAAIACEPAPSVAEPGELRAMRRAIEHLSDADREVIELRHHAQMSFKQIADLLGEPIGTLLARHHRALRKLREMIGPETRDTRLKTGITEP